MYADIAAMVVRFGEHELIMLSDRATPPLRQIVSEVIDTALTDAGEVINGYCRSRYSVPLLPVPPMIKRLQCDIARFFLYDQSRAIPEGVEEAYKQALKILGEISKGSVVLEIGSSSAPSVGQSKAVHPYRPLDFSGFRS